MPIPKSLEALMDHGVVEQVVRPLRSGKEAEVYLVVSEGAYRVAKVYKDAQHRTFRNRATYTEGRTVRNSRDQRAMAKRTSHGKARDEAAWRSTEVDMIYKLRAAGVRVPTPYHYVDGILIMELVSTAAGDPAPRLGEIPFSVTDAKQVYEILLAEVVRMLSAGVVHGDLSEFNVLMSQRGPCIIDFPQSIHAAGNANARTLLLRDVGNLHRFLTRFVPNRRPLPYAEEMWQLYEKGELTPTTQLTGQYTPQTKSADVDVVMAIIEEAKRDERQRQARMGEGGYARKKSAAAARAAQSGPEQESRENRQPGNRRPSPADQPGNNRAAGNRASSGGNRGSGGGRAGGNNRPGSGNRPGGNRGNAHGAASGNGRLSAHGAPDGGGRSSGAKDGGGRAGAHGAPSAGNRSNAHGARGGGNRSSGYGASSASGGSNAHGGAPHGGGDGRPGGGSGGRRRRPPGGSRRG